MADYFQRDQKEIASKFLLKLCPRLEEVKILSSIVCTGWQEPGNTYLQLPDGGLKQQSMKREEEGCIKSCCS